MNNDLISREALKRKFALLMWKEHNPYDTVKVCDFVNQTLDFIDNAPTIEERPQGKWIITAEDNEGIHRIQCPFCRYEKGSDFIDYITVTFEKLPPFCENCGAELKGGAEE